jgi:hypothetical protein
MMSRLPADPPEEQAEAVMQTDPMEWEFHDDPMTWVLTTNRDYSIKVRNPGDRDTREREQSEWASVFPNETTAANRIRVRYRGAPFTQLPILHLDEFRQHLVHPRTDHEADDDEIAQVLTTYEMHLSRIMSGGDFGGYADALDIRVED